MTMLTRRDRWRAAANQRIRQVLAVRRASIPPRPAPTPAADRAATAR